MTYYICLLLSIISLLSTIFFIILISKRKNNKKNSKISNGFKYNELITVPNILIVGIFISVFIIFIPIYGNDFFNNESILIKIFKTFWISLHHTIRLFIIDTDFEIIQSSIGLGKTDINTFYSCYVALLYILAPVSTVIKSLTFISKISSQQKLKANFNKDMYVFSDINKKSIALAKSISNTFPNVAIVFTNVLKEEKYLSEDLEELNKLKIIRLEKDILSIDFRKHNSKKQLYFFVISEDEEKNALQGLNLIEDYKNIPNSWLYVFNSTTEGEVLFSSFKLVTDETIKKIKEKYSDENAAVIEAQKELAENKNLTIEEKNHLNTLIKEFNIKVERESSPKHMRIRRINDISSLVTVILDKNGANIFKEGKIDENNPNQKNISALVVGMGKLGFEMAKSLVWFGQMDGYKLDITCVDKAEDIESKFIKSCPELIKKENNNNFEDDGEAQYSLNIVSNITLESQQFIDLVKEKKNLSYVFIAFGTDEMNINAAFYLRTLFRKYGINPRIQTVIQSFDRINALNNFQKNNSQYNIDFIDDLHELYCYKSLIDSDIIKKGLERHMKWGYESDFWQNEYNYNSSIASALHRKMKEVCEIPGIKLKPEERTEHERDRIRIMEHRRWNAYMRSVGYTLGDKKDKLAKTHPCLVTFKELPLYEQEKDDD